MKRKFFLTQCILFAFIVLHAQDRVVYLKKNFIQGQDTLLYRLLLPDGYQASKKYPVILFLHGSGERGSDNEMQLVHGANLFTRMDIRKKFPSIVVFPQCPLQDKWADYTLTDSAGTRSFSLVPGSVTKTMSLLEGLLKQLGKNYKIDPKRMYVGGLSMGGMGTFALVNRNPVLFAAAFPICGAAPVSSARNIKNVSWWIFHGAKDNVVPPASSIAIAAALKREKAKVKFTLYPDANHNSWDAAFAEKDLLPWLFSQHK